LKLCSTGIASKAREPVVYLGEDIELRGFNPDLATYPKESNVYLQTSKKKKLTPNPMFTSISCVNVNCIRLFPDKHLVDADSIIQDG
jgi:hypothetical protein